ncbi:MAG: fumarylacetoacetate hydrolase family protein [Planctomycetes bacterium]|nr:fumarylacetoacetate hydrolase family protein [Planctomycetota bacterium]
MMRQFMLSITLVACSLIGTVASAEAVKYCRFQAGDTVAYGIVEGELVRQLAGDLFGEWEKTETTFPLKEVKLLVPSPRPAHVLAMAGNYRSHLANEATVTTTITTVTKIVTNTKTDETTSDSTTTSETRRSGEVPKKFQIPQPFFKSPSSLIAHGDKIVIPKDAGIVHYEAEMVIVIGKTAKNVSPEQAKDCILGVTCGNDISARAWQKNDVQWWRAKASDTFGPCGPFILSGVNYNDLQMELRLNGEVKQKENTSQLIHNVENTVSFISQYITLQPGDLIFSGTPGETSEIKAGDVLEVEIGGVGVLRNNVVGE